MTLSNVPLYIIDGLLLLTFLAGWLESTAISTYRLTVWRFLRAISLPLALGSLLHLMTARNWWLPLLAPFAGLTRPELKWLIDPLSAGVFGLVIIVGVPYTVMGLLAFVISQFTSRSPVIFFVESDGGVNFGVPANPTETDSQPEQKDKNNNSSP